METSHTFMGTLYKRFITTAKKINIMSINIKKHWIESKKAFYLNILAL